jgi:hypothetical protein
MDKVKCLIGGTGLTAEKIYSAMDFIRLDDEDVLMAVIQDDDGYKHFLSPENWEKVEEGE